jgi:hypothetical protein
MNIGRFRREHSYFARARETLTRKPSASTNCLISLKKKFRTFRAKYGALEKIGPERTKRARWAHRWYGTDNQNRCRNSGISAASDQAENWLSK